MELAPFRIATARRARRGAPFVSAVVAAAAFLIATAPDAEAQELRWPPALPGGSAVVTDSSDDFVTVPRGVTLRAGTAVASTPPVIDFMYFPEQTYEGNPWSNWGDGLAVGTHRYYTTIGDHRAPAGTALVYAYDAGKRELRLLADTRTWLEASGTVPAGTRYRPAKIHTRLDLGSDGWLYYATHRGSTRQGTDDEHGYLGDWVLRTHPESGETELVARHPVAKHAIPAGVLDGERMIYYGGTISGRDAPAQGAHLFVWDVEAGKLRLESPEGFDRYAILSRSTGRLYWRAKGSGRALVYDPATNSISASPNVPDVRSATRETPDGVVYGTSDMSDVIWAFDTRSETLTELGRGASGAKTYITAMEADPTGRYLYYVPGAHGGIAEEGTAIMQFDTRTRTRKVIAFVGPYYRARYGYTPDGTFGIGLSEDGATLYVTWNGNRVGRSGARYWDAAALMVVHIPESERRP
jgi:hypothetical protein